MTCTRAQKPVRCHLSSWEAPHWHELDLEPLREVLKGLQAMAVLLQQPPSLEELLRGVALHLPEVSQLLLRRFHTDLESGSILCFFSGYQFSVVLTAVEVSIEVRHGLDPGLVSGGGKRKSGRAVTARRNKSVTVKILFCAWARSSDFRILRVFLRKLHCK